MLRRSLPRTLEAALRDLGAARATTRAAAVRDLARHGDEHRDRVLEALERALGDESAEVRAAAAIGFADAGAASAPASLLAAVADPDTDVQQMALAALGEIRDAGALATVEQALGNAAPTARFQAVIAFPRLCDDRARVTAMLLRATGDEDAHVRHIALRMAEEVGGEGDAPVDEAIADRAREMVADESEGVRVAAAVVLGRCGRRDGARILAAVAGREIASGGAEDEAAAIELCGELGIAAAVPALERRAFAGILANDPFAWQARVSLAQLGHPRAVRWVLDELRAWTRERRTLAVAAAGRARIGAARARIEAMRGDPSRADPHAVEEALKALVSDPGR
jgi:HEAT repeat protein